MARDTDHGKKSKCDSACAYDRSAHHESILGRKMLIGPCDPTILRGLMPDRICGPILHDPSWVPGVRWMYQSSMPSPHYSCVLQLPSLIRRKARTLSPVVGCLAKLCFHFGKTIIQVTKLLRNWAVEPGTRRVRQVVGKHNFAGSAELGSITLPRAQGYMDIILNIMQA